MMPASNVAAMTIINFAESAPAASAFPPRRVTPSAVLFRDGPALFYFVGPVPVVAGTPTIP
jgi:hypothetical protein